MRRYYKLKITKYSVKEDFSKGKKKKKKKLWDQDKKLRKDGKHTIIKYDKVVTRNFQPRW